MANKLNMAAVKGFLILHGEKVALGVCGFIAISFGIMGLMRAANAGLAEGTPMNNLGWADAFKQVKTKLERAREGVQPVPMSEETKEKLKEDAYGWKEIATKYEPIPYLTQPDDLLGNKRYNPVALAVNSDPNTMRLQYLNCGILVYDYNPVDKTVNTLVGADGEAAAKPMPGNPLGKKGEAGAGALPTYAHDVRPARMVVGTMIFPLKKLVADYTKALRQESQHFLLTSPDPDDLPRFLGFNLMRFELLPNGEYANKELILGYDPETKQMKVSAALRRMLRDAVYEEHVPEYLEPYIFAGLTMPTPKLANRSYPKPNIPGLDLSRWEGDPKDLKNGKKGQKDGGMPGIALPGSKKNRPGPGPGPGGDDMGKKVAKAESRLVPLRYKELLRDDRRLANRLFSKDMDKDFNIYHVFGLNPPASLLDNKGANPAMPRMPAPGAGMGENNVLNETRFFSAWKVPLGDEFAPGADGPGPGVMPRRPMPPGGEQPGGPGGVEAKDWDRDAIVRFVDIDVEPGKTYVYGVQVRIANPNYKKTTLVAFNALANNAELPLNQANAWTWTNEKAITIPHEYFIYAVDQFLLDEWAKGDKKSKVVTPKDTTAIQVHQWVKYKDDRALGIKQPVADWAIAERLLVGRGEDIGLGSVVALPVWRETKDAFEIPMELRDPKKTREVKYGMRIDLRPVVIEKDGSEHALPAPVLVDFSGGRRKAPGLPDEESAVDALILDSTGKLILRNTRFDTDTSSPVGRDRRQRLSTVRARITEIYHDSLPDAKNPMGPGGPMGP